MKGYKAFEKGMICRGKQYAENTIFEEKKAEICRSGMHFCKNPLDVFDYYPLVDNDGNITEFAEVEALDDCKTDDNKKYCTKKLKIGAKIDFNDLLQAEVNKTTSKDSAQIGSSGYYAKIGSSGDSAKIGSSGDSAQIGSSGDWANIISTGKNAVVCCAGKNSIAKAKKGSWITLSEWNYDKNKEAFIPMFVKTEYVDGKKIKEDTFYKLKNGKFVECGD